MTKKSIGTLSESIDAGYLGVATDPTPNDLYTVSGVLAGLPTPESYEVLIQQVNDATLALRF